MHDWLRSDVALLTVLDGIKRSARDWAANGKLTTWLAHSGERLRSAERLLERTDLAASLEPTDKEYVRACEIAQRSARSRAQRVTGLVGGLAVLLILGGLAWWKQGYFANLYHWHVVMGPSVLTAAGAREKAAKPGSPFHECANGCPEMVVLPAGPFTMGSPDNIGEPREHPAHPVNIPRPFAVATHELTFDEWDHCAAAGGCRADVGAKGYGRGPQPVINISWNDAQRYVTWLSRVTGGHYRLLTEAEWEYAARANSSTLFSFGNDDAQLAQYGWYTVNATQRPHPVGQLKPNAFKLYDMHGNVSEWVEDCDSDSYQRAPQDGSAFLVPDCRRRIRRGGSFLYSAKILRSASRDLDPADLISDRIGMRVARTLEP